jgi:hypothetical protein
MADASRDYEPLRVSDEAIKAAGGWVAPSNYFMEPKPGGMADHLRVIRNAAANDPNCPPYLRNALSVLADLCHKVEEPSLFDALPEIKVARGGIRFEPGMYPKPWSMPSKHAKRKAWRRQVQSLLAERVDTYRRLRQVTAELKRYERQAEHGDAELRRLYEEAATCPMHRGHHDD